MTRLLLPLLLLPTVLLAADPVISDTFDTLNTEPTGWMLAGPTRVVDGKLQLVANASGDYAYSGAARVGSSDQLFFAAPRTLTVDGITCVHDDGVLGKDVNLTVAIVSPHEPSPAAKAKSDFKAPLEWAAPTAVGVNVRGDGQITLGYKVAQPLKGLNENVLLTRTAAEVTGFSLTLGDTSWKIVIRSKGKDGKLQETTETGAWTDKGPGLKANDFADGKAAVIVKGSRSKIAASTGDVIWAIDALTYGAE